MQIDSKLLQQSTIILTVVYSVLLIGFCLIYHIWPGPEFLVVFISIYAVSRNWTRHFVKDWIPFTALFLSYEAMYGFVDNITGIVHVSELRNLELRIFGQIPSLLFQQLFRDKFLDYLSIFLYSLHFFLPLGFGFLLWRYAPKYFSRFITAFLLCSYSALIVFLVYPSAPPWYGAGAIRIIFQTAQSSGMVTYSTIFDYLDANPFAAFPSLHSAYPFLISLYALMIKGVRALPILLLPFGIWFSVVYLGEHYVVDVLGGIVFSTSAYLIVEKLIPRLETRYSARIRTL